MLKMFGFMNDVDTLKLNIHIRGIYVSSPSELLHGHGDNCLILPVPNEGALMDMGKVYRYVTYTVRSTKREPLLH